MSFRASDEQTAVSPVVAVILLVAVTVTLSAVIGGFALELGQSTTSDTNQQSIGTTTAVQNGTATVTVVTGTADKLIVKTANETRNITSPSAGDTATISVSQDSDITVISVHDDSKTVVSSTTYTPSTTVSESRGWLIDDFEDNDLYEYSNTTNSSIVTSPVYNGSYSVALTATASHEKARLISYNITPQPQPGDTFSVWVYGNDNQIAFEFARQNDTAYYQVNQGVVADEFRLKKLKNGSVAIKKKTTLTWPTNTWTRIEITWNKSGKLTARAYDTSGSQLAKVSMTDSEYGKGGIGFYHWDNDGLPSTSYFDYTHLNNSS